MMIHRELVYETADVISLLVLLAEKNIPYEAIEAELASREGGSEQDYGAPRDYKFIMYIALWVPTITHVFICVKTSL